MTISIGEKLETVIVSRATGAHGEYLGSSAGVWGMAKVEGMTFKVDSFSEFGAFNVTHVESGNVETIEDRYEIPLAVDRLAMRAKAADQAHALDALQRAGYKAKGFGEAIRVIDPNYTMSGGSRRPGADIVTLRGNDLAGQVRRFLDVRS
ncbi:hypothetical protein IPC1293_31110 [Pseudomonas aeruginosa]|uniref:hypothetical protein n=1 Tax=Pseudomonas aeruginosa TaxID=287 RepID=UPI000F523E9A|nr:hypothetical protein [Pseudomonas aeruginosa]RPM25821.1 hypothetical protein IPC1293_31110 [Pseudomonas aeruginosa]